jgi:sortase (surface protein transpeptidase)
MSRGRHAARVSRPAGLITLLAGLLVAFGGGAEYVHQMHENRLSYDPRNRPHVTVPHGRVAELASATASHRVPRPIFLYIPAIGVQTRLVRLGITAQGAPEVPGTARVAGWYTSSARPGAIGPSIIAGHVDSHTSPGVFFLLRYLRRGDMVYVMRGNATIVQFKITKVRIYSKSAFPSRAVDSPVPYAAIRLITCGGEFDHATGHYLSNVIAFGYQVSRGKAAK